MISKIVNQRTFNLIGIALLLASLIFGIERFAFIFSASKSIGEVVSFEKATKSNSSINSQLEAPVVKFTSEDGVENKFTSSLALSWEHYAIGQKVGVIYATENPLKARINSLVGIYLVPAAFFLIALSFFWTSFLMRLKEKRR